MNAQPQLMFPGTDLAVRINEAHRACETAARSALTHALECAFFLPTLRKTGRPLGFEVAQTLFFGMIHYAEVKAALLANAETGEESAG